MLSRHMVGSLSGLMIAAVVTPAAVAQPPATPARTIMVVPPCPPPPTFPGWGRTHGGVAPIWLARDPVPELLLGDTAYLPLSPVEAVKLAVPLGKPAQPGDRAGLVTFQAPTAGTYRIALGGRAWIDVVRDGRTLASSAHRMGTACSGIAKMVDFRLEPGRYTIQLSAAAQPSMRIAIARLP